MHPQKRKNLFATISQYCVFSFSLFNKNGLITYAAAGAYGFLCSFLPTVMMIAIILIRLFHTSPNKIFEFLHLNNIFIQTIEINRIIASILEVKTIGILEIIIGISVFWMAQRFFLSIMRSFHHIFSKHTQGKRVIISLFSIAIEIGLVIAVSVVVFLLVIIQTLLHITGLIQYIPFFLQKSVLLLLELLPLALTILFVTVLYRFASRSKPQWKVCILAATCCTVSFFAIEKCLRIFIDFSRYNLVYGVLSNLIVLLLEVFIFFVLLLFFAQFIFVYQFFDQLLFEQIYLLPPSTATKPKDSLIRHVFIKPQFFITLTHETFTPNSFVFTETNESRNIFYIEEGIVSCFYNNHIDYYSSGSFFGELECLLNVPRFSRVQAQTTVHILRIPYTEFENLLIFSPEANKKTTAMLTDFFEKQSAHPVLTKLRPFVNTLFLIV